MLPFTAPKDYPEMLVKIAMFFVASMLAAMVVLRLASPDAALAFRSINPPIKFAPLGLDGLPLLYCIVPFGAGVLSRLIKLHDRISDIFGIRRRFDVHEILVPLVAGTGYTVDSDQVDAIEKRRGKLMDDIFYTYASSTNPVIDKHLVVMALDRWCWYWIVVEATFIAFATDCTLIALHCDRTAAWMGLLVGALIVVCALAPRLCIEGARDQVRAILKDPARRDAIKKATATRLGLPA